MDDSEDDLPWTPRRRGDQMWLEWKDTPGAAVCLGDFEKAAAKLCDFFAAEDFGEHPPSEQH